MMTFGFLLRRERRLRRLAREELRLIRLGRFEQALRYREERRSPPSVQT